MILIVDDEQFNLDAITIILKFKFQINIKEICTCALSGEEALEIIKKDAQNNDYFESSYKLILMDYNMPKLNGPDTSILIREFLKSKKLV